MTDRQQRRHKHRHHKNHRHQANHHPHEELPKIVFIGPPNVGESALFNALTGSYVMVSNYPGTTVELSKGRVTIQNQEYEVIDTPGMYSFSGTTEDERVGRRLVLSEDVHVVIHPVDTKNLDRMLPSILQMREAGFPLIVVLNIIDEAEKLGIHVDPNQLSELLGVPVVPTVAIHNQGIDELKELVHNFTPATTPYSSIPYDEHLELGITKLVAQLQNSYTISKRSIAILLLEDDPEIHDFVKRLDPSNYPAMQEIIRDIQSAYGEPITYLINMARYKTGENIFQKVFQQSLRQAPAIQERIGRLMSRPLTGIPIFLAVLYFGLYWFVGVFGAQILVEILEEGFFGTLFNPWIIGITEAIIPFPWLQSLFIGDYGIFTLALRYAFAVILPLVVTFFLAFSVLEDSGYFPRLSLMIDTSFKKIGLNGRAIIPMILGFGCDTMATLVTRTLDTRREKTIATLLLALAIPCSAQLGVILGLLSLSPLGMLIWVLVVTGVFLGVGYLGAKVLPGTPPSFYMEIPPIRLPKLKNIIIKTYTRLEWYLREVIPIFVVASILIWIGQLTGVFQLLIIALQPLVGFLGLPPETAVVFLFGFFRRDYGAAGLFDLYAGGLIQGANLVVASVTLTLFLPCIAQLSIMIHERGWKTALAITLFTFSMAILVGWTLNMAITFTGIGGFL